MRGPQGLSALPARDNTALETHRPLSHSLQLSEDLVSKRGSGYGLIGDPAVHGHLRFA